MPDGLNEKHVRGQKDRVRYGVKVLPCVTNTPNRGKGDVLHSCPMGMSHETTLLGSNINASHVSNLPDHWHICHHFVAY